MAEYIDRDELYEQMHAMGMGFDLIEALEMIENFPAADVVPVVRGRWTPIINAYGELEGWMHEHCGTETKCKFTYCPNCGAKMDG